MKLYRFSLLLFLSTSFFGAPAAADLLYFYGAMDGFQGPAPTGSTATGAMSWLMDTNADTISYLVTSSPLVLSNAHIHGPAGPTQSGGVLHAINFPLPTSAVYFYQPSDEAFIIAGLTYTNLHTNAFPNGEIRGQNLLTAKAMCFGDGSGTACPCLGNGATGQGCKNTLGSGAGLAPFGSTSVALDDMTFHGTNLIPGNPALLFNAQTDVAGGNGAPFGGGLLCGGGLIQRMTVAVPDAGGSASWGPNLSSVGVWGPGDRRFFQIWYRDVNNQPCGGGFNTSNALDITFN